MQDIDKISKQMRLDWDRRIQHDYRFWMSDGHADDQQMWSSGKRDFEILTNKLNLKEVRCLLDVGCGVGRLLNAAADQCPNVIGIDVSSEAIKKAQELLSQKTNAKLFCGNGLDLNQIPSESVDLLISFAALSSMPVDIFARYLLEFKRVCSKDATLRLQFYLGENQNSRRHDTLFPRCYKKANIEKALQAVGFDLEWVEELILPFQVSYKEIGIEAVVISLKVNSQAPSLDYDELAKVLLPEGEHNDLDASSEQELEYWMALTYAKELFASGKLDKAKATLDYAITFNKNVSTDVQDMLKRIESELDRSQNLGNQTADIKVGVQNQGTVLFELNIKVLQERYPDLAEQVINNLQSEMKDLDVESIGPDPVLIYKGTNLDHATKPQAAADNWVQRNVNRSIIQSANGIAVYGFGSAYHLESLLRVSDKEISVIEPSLDVFTKALCLRDLREVLAKLKHICVADLDTLKFFDQTIELLVRPQTQQVAFEFLGKVKTKFYGARGVATLKPQIAVVGPLQGGTLPIMEYTTRALATLGQRVRQIDMSSFAGGYTGVGGIIANELLQARAHGRYIETMSELVLDSLTERPVDILICMAQAPLSTKVLDEIKKRGIITVLWFVEDYHRFTSWKVYAKHFDFIFTIQKEECINAVIAAGCENVHYLPTACDPYVHVPNAALSAEEQKRWGSDVSFVGAGYHNRQQLFAYLTGLDFKIWGTEWPTCRPFDNLVQEEGRRLKPEEYIKIFNSSKINLNLHSSTERDGVDPSGDFVNPRTFELAAAGAFQLVDPRRYLTDYFEPGKDLVTFENIRELKEKINYYLAHPEERIKIANQGRQTVLEKHTYQHRMHEMLSIIYSLRYEQLKARVLSSPWTGMIEKSKRHPELHARCEHAFKKGEEPTLDALVADIVTGKGELTETEQKLLFLYHVSRQTIRMKKEEMGIS